MSEPGQVRRLFVFGSLYMAQGIVYGFGGFILVPVLAAGGVALEDQAGILALAGLPWVLKLLWAPLLDRFGGAGTGRLRWFAALAMVGMAAALFVLASRDSLVDDPAAVAWLWLLVNVGLSLQDVATDAMVIDRVSPAQRGLANGVLLGGRHIGVEGVGSLGLGLLFASHGLPAALGAQAVIMLLLAGVPLLLPSQPPGPRPSVATSQLRGALQALLSSRQTLAVAGVAVVLMSADVLTGTISGQFWVQRLGWSVEDLSTRLAPLLLGVNLVAYVGATLSVDRLGAGRAAALGSATLGSLWIGFGLVPGLWTSTAFLVAFVSLQAGATAVFYVGIHAALMNSTQPAVRASHFAVLMALLNLPRAVVAPAAPGVLEALGYAGLFIAAGGAQVLLAGAVGLVWRRSSS